MNPMPPEFWYGIGAAVLLAALVFAVIRAGRLTAKERQRTDAATRDLQRREETSRR